MHAPARLNSMRRMHRNRIVRMNPDGIASQVHPRSSRIVSNRKVEIHDESLVDGHTQKVALRPLEEKRPNRQISEAALAPLRVGIDVCFPVYNLCAVQCPS